MEMAQVNDLAGIMLDSYDETAMYARSFVTEHDWPMTVLAKAQLFRSIVQSRVVKEDRFDLSNAYVSMGRVLVTDTTLNTDLLIRSEKALRIEQEQLDPTLDLDVRRVLSGVKLLVYRFSKTDFVVVRVLREEGQPSTSSGRRTRSHWVLAVRRRFNTDRGRIRPGQRNELGRGRRRGRRGRE
jgi:hypothetical protein